MTTIGGTSRRFPTIRSLFWGLALLILILLPILSLDAGISGDEPVHNQQARLVYDYFQSKGSDTRALETPETFLKLYGQVFDNLAFTVNRILKTNSPFPVRHLMNSLVGAFTILLCGLLAIELAGYPAGILAMLLLLLSPRFIGHSFNNLKDIPFAFGYLLTIYSLIRSNRSLPRIHWKWVAGMAFGTGFTLATRPGGLILFPIIALFTGWQALLTKPETAFLHPRNLNYFARLALTTLLLLLVAFGLGIMDWPYALQNPLVHPFRALAEMTRYQVSIRQLFEGRLTWSEHLPWYYVLKWFLIGSPVVVLTGLALFLGRFSWSKNRLTPPIIILLFCAFFPFFWVILKNSNLYGGYRHFLFVYPLFCAFAAMAYFEIYRLLQHRWLKIILMAMVCLGLLFPAMHMARNHPLEYIYFNKISGGITKANGRYETDYYFHSLGPAYHWLIKNQKLFQKQPLRVASNFPLEAYIQDTTHIRWVYTPYYERGKLDWDVGLFINSGLSPYQLRNNGWPPTFTIHTIDVDHVPMAAIVRRDSKSDLWGIAHYHQSQFQDAVDDFKQALYTDSKNETALLYLGYCYRAMNRTTESINEARELIRIHPESEPGRILLGLNYLSEKNFIAAREIALEVIRLNHKFMPGYALAAQASDSLGEFKQSEYYKSELTKY